MAEIKRFPLVRHLRADASSYVLRYKRGKLTRSGRGLAFWFRPLSTSVAEVPVEDREVTFVFRGRSSDFQDVTAQGVTTYRVISPETLVDRVDFSVALDTGSYRKEPLEFVAQLITQLAQQAVLQYFISHPLRELVVDSGDELRSRIRSALTSTDGVAELGIEIASVRLTAIQATAELERALQTPTLESIQQRADEATFQRRALAVEKERAIAENELHNQIELARQEEKLIAQQGANRRAEATDQVQAERIAAEGAAERVRMTATAEAERIRLVEAANNVAEGERLTLYKELPRQLILGLAAKELAGKLERIDHVNISPDMLSPLLGDLMTATTTRLKGES
jgi:regulator of protease activity HflC (stomatin/prohibitin superfamily)